MHRAIPFIFALVLAGVAPGGEIPEHLKATRTLDFSLPAAHGYTQHGYRISGPEDHGTNLVTGTGILANNGGRYLNILSTGAPVSLVQADGTAFDVLSMDVAEYSTVAIPSVVSFRGTKGDGTVLSFDFIPDRIIDGSGPKQDFEAVTFPPGWTELERLEITTTRVALDNITVRGLALDHFNPKEESPLRLELLGTLDSDSYDSWGVTGSDGEHVYLRSLRYPSDPVSLSSFSLVTGEIVQSVWISGGSGGNLETGETAWVQDDSLVWSLGEESQVLATVGSDGVTGISYPRPANGRVLFANHWYQGHEKYAVFLAGPQGVTPVLTPETILPDGGTPHYFPRELHYTGSSFAIATSTSKSDSLYVISFAGGPLRLSPGNRDLIPGTGFHISGQPMLRWLDDNSAGFIVETDGTSYEQFDLMMLADGSWTVTRRAGPAWSARTPLPGWGFFQRHYSTVATPPGTPLLTYGPIECNDLSPNNRHGLVSWTEDGGRHLLIREGVALDGFGTVGQVFSQAHTADGWFYVTARSAQGQIGLFRGRLPVAVPAVRAGAFVPMADGTMRFMVENLTHGRDYVVEQAGTLAGPWTPASRFTAGSPGRSVLGAFSRGSRGFFRVVEVE